MDLPSYRLRLEQLVNGMSCNVWKLKDHLFFLQDSLLQSYIRELNNLTSSSTECALPPAYVLGSSQTLLIRKNESDFKVSLISRIGSKNSSAFINAAKDYSLANWRRELMAPPGNLVIINVKWDPKDNSIKSVCYAGIDSTIDESSYFTKNRIEAIELATSRPLFGNYYKNSRTIVFDGKEIAAPQRFIQCLNSKQT